MKQHSTGNGTRDHPTAGRPRGDPNHHRLGTALTLLGTFGSGETPKALLRLRNGDTTTVARGDSINGQTVIAIEEGRVALARNGATEWLEMPAPNS